MTVSRPDELRIIDVDIVFNRLSFTKLEIDLEHINRGKWLTRFTNFSIDDVIILVNAFVDGEFIESKSQREYGDEICDYYSITKRFQGNIYRLVFCICSDRKDTLGIITLHRTRK